jgi:hypothetical protein
MTQSGDFGMCNSDDTLFLDLLEYEFVEFDDSDVGVFKRDSFTTTVLKKYHEFVEFGDREVVGGFVNSVH